MAISVLKIRRPLGRLIFNMGIAIPGKTVFLIETAPRVSTAFAQFSRNIPDELTHLPLEKMAATLADDNFKSIFLDENDRIPIRFFPLKFVPRSPIDNTPALVQVMAWCLTGDRPLPEPMLTQFTDAYMRHLGGRWVKYI